MKKLFHVTTISLVMMLTFGCATKAYLPTYSDSMEYGTLTLFRVNTEPTAPRLNIYAEDKKVAALRNYDTVTFSLPVGVHQLSIDWNNTDHFFKNVISINVEGKEQYYVAIIHSFNISNVEKHPRRIEWFQGEMAHAILLDKQSAEKIIHENIL